MDIESVREDQALARGDSYQFAGGAGCAPILRGGSQQFRSEASGRRAILRGYPAIGPVLAHHERTASQGVVTRGRYL